MKKSIVEFLVLLLVLSSCSVKKEHIVASAFLNDLRKPFSNQVIDTIELVDYSSVVDKSILELYLKRKTEKYNCADCINITWTKPSYEWILNESEISFMLDEILKHKKIIWDVNKLNTKIKKIQIVDYPIFYDNYNKDIEIQRLIKNERYIAFLSKPIFNKKGNIAIISCDMVLLPNMGITKIYVKEKKNWILAGKFVIK